MWLWLSGTRVQADSNLLPASLWAPFLGNVPTSTIHLKTAVIRVKNGNWNETNYCLQFTRWGQSAAGRQIEGMGMTDTATLTCQESAAKWIVSLAENKCIKLHSTCWSGRLTKDLPHNLSIILCCWICRGRGIFSTWVLGLGSESKKSAPLILNASRHMCAMAHAGRGRWMKGTKLKGSRIWRQVGSGHPCH